MSDSEELRTYIQECMASAESAYKDQYAAIKDDLEFSASNQWDESILNDRELNGRPSVVINQVRKYINRIVNPLRANPIGIQIDANDADVARIVNGAVRSIEYKSDAQEAYEIAFENAVTAGIGWIKVSTDYVSDMGLDQKITIDSIDDPTMVYIDPFSKRVDGSDAEWGFCITPISEKKAKKEHGSDIGSAPFGISIYENWICPEDSVWEVTFYRLARKKVRYYYLADGSKSTEKSELSMGDRLEYESVCEVFQFVGQKLVAETTLPIKRIPIVPVYGDKISLKDRKWAGVVHWTRDQQKLLNFYKSNEVELIALSPVSPFIGTADQFDGYENIWAESNRSPQAYLPYNAVDKNGNLLPRPERADNSAQTGGLINSAMAINASIGESLGMPDALFGQMASANESGRAVQLYQSFGEISTAQYANNLSKSIKGVGDVVLQLIPVIYDTEREVDLYDKETGTEKQILNLGTIVENIGSFDITTHAGPSFESKRRASLDFLMDLARNAGDRSIVIWDKIAELSQVEGAKELADRFRKMLPPEMLSDENAPDPKAIEALQIAEATINEQQKTIDQAEAIIQQLQSALIDNQADRDAKIITEQIKSETTLAKARLDNQTKLLIEGNKADASLTQEAMKQEGENSRMIAEIQAEAVKEISEKVGEALNGEITRTEPNPEAVDVDNIGRMVQGPFTL